MHDPDISVEDYLRVIRYKTAKLFEASARIGAVLAGSDNPLEEACTAYGQALGTAFQIVDDLLDYEAPPLRWARTSATTCASKPTLPLLAAMNRSTPEERELIRHAIQNGEVDRLDEIVAIVRRTGALDITREAARAEAERARARPALPSSQFKDALLRLTVLAVDRALSNQTSSRLKSLRGVA
ncbi:MAG: polyprenyl synthetase family protein [Sphaerotilus natans]